MKKRMISLLLVLALAVGICPAALAGETDEVKIAVTDVGHGEYAVVNEVKRNSETYYAENIDPDGSVYYIKDIDQYIMEVDDGRFLATEQNIINVSDVEEVASWDLPQEVKDSICRDIENHGTASGILYAPASTGAATRANPEISHYTYNGYQMSQYLYTNPNKFTKFQDVVSGVNTRKVAEGISNMTVTCLGKVFPPVNITVSGFNLFKDFLIASGLGSEAVTATSNDSLQVAVVGTKYEKFTYVYDAGIGTNRLGAATERVKVTYVASSQYYAAVGVPDIEPRKDLNEIYSSPHYSNPNDVAISSVMEPLLENNMCYSIHNLNVDF